MPESVPFRSVRFGPRNKLKAASQTCIAVLALSAALVAASSPAMAQQAIPPSAEAPRAQDQVPAPYAITVPAPSAAADIAPQRTPDGAESVTFTLQSITIEGMSAYTPSAIAPLYEAQIGQVVTLADMFALAQAITRRYRADGYILSQAVVPQQTIENGAVTLRVVEGFFSAVTLEGVDETSLLGKRIRRMTNRLSAERPVTAATMEHTLLVVNDIPGLRARSVISPSQTIAGGADLMIVIEDDILSGQVAIDNFGSRYLGPVQLSNTTHISNALGYGERITGQIVSAPAHSEMLYGYAAFQTPIGSQGTVFGVDATYSDTAPGYTLDPFDVEGFSTVFGGGFKHSFIRSREENLFGRLRFDWRKASSKSTIDITRTDRVASLRLGGDYQRVDTLWNIAVNSLSFDLSKGVGLFGTSDKNDPTLSRANGDPRHTKAELEVERLQKIADDWTALAVIRGQIASHALLSAEEFGVGGHGLGRGYSPSEITGDNGFAGSFELQWASPQMHGEVMNRPQFFAFYDFGKVWNKSEVASVQKKDSLASTGFGLRTGLLNTVNTEVSVALPLTRDVATSGDREVTVYFTLSVPY